MVELPGVGKRKLAVTIVVAVAIMGLGHWGLMAGELSGAEWVAASRTVAALALAFIGGNVVKGIWGKE